MDIARIDVSGAMAHVRHRNLVPAGLVGGYITVHYCDTRWECLTKIVIFNPYKRPYCLTAPDKWR